MNRKTCTTKVDGGGERMLEAAISTISVDRDGDVLLPSGIRTDEFNRNPVVLLGHDAGSLPIGTATQIRRTPNAVLAEMKFADRPMAHPDAAEWVPDTVYDLFKQGVLNAFSVGFTIDAARPASKKDVRRFGDRVRRVVTDWNLLEFSVVTIPANQDALVTAVKSGTLRQDSYIFDALDEEPPKLSVQSKRLVLDSAPRRLRLG